MSLTCLVPARTAAVRKRYAAQKRSAREVGWFWRGRRIRPWSPAEDDYLRRHGATSTKHQLVDALKRPKSSVYLHLEKLGIKPILERSARRKKREQVAA